MTEYECSDGTKIPFSWICDDYLDCPSEEDEEGCGKHNMLEL